MSLSSWVVGWLVVVCLAGCSGPSRGSAPDGPSGAGAGDRGVSNGGATTSGGSSNTSGSSTDTKGTNGGTHTDAGGGSPEMTAGGAEGGSNESGLGGAGGLDSSDACVGIACESPPSPACDGTSTLTTYDAIGSCTNGTCGYVSHSTECACDGGACDIDPCLAVKCSTPPAAHCQDSTRLVAYTATGTCAKGSCSYPGTETVCEFGCSHGGCQANPCASVTCNQPPATTCKDGNTKVGYAVSGACNEGSCSYAATETSCTFGCASGACLPDPCLAVKCDSPPSPGCDSPTRLRTYDKIGSCAAGACAYTTHLIACSCQAGSCVVDPCQSVTCKAPPAPICKDPGTLTTYAETGTCKAGSCGYAALDKACPFGCENGACEADPCAALTCNQPPPAICKNASTKTTYAAKGSCIDGGCSYTAMDSTCAFGCENGACKADPCDAVSCNQPPGAACKDLGTKTTYAPKGSCSGGNCSYTSTDTSCGNNQLCEGAGECSVCSSDEKCGPNCNACAGPTPKCRLSGLTSTCVACVSDLDCGGANPKCNTATNVCGPVPSCIGLAKTCGPAGDQDCCASGLVTGGTFYRGDNPQYPATVSDFRLDKYEITVGRFRKFVAAYQQNMTTAGAGRNPNNPNDPGWDVDWNFDMPADKAALTTSLKCSGGTDVWHDSAGSAQSESLPLPCLSWFAAEAFCIWDGGRLATDAEWDYAASGGDEQRPYPWGSAAPDCAHANSGAAPCGDQVNRVGSESPLGDGRYGQADLAGNLREWTQDWFFPHNQSNDPVYSSTTCVNCAELTPYGDRIFWGGSFVDDLGQGFQFRAGSGPYYGSPLVGARCARMP